MSLCSELLGDNLSTSVRTLEPQPACLSPHLRPTGSSSHPWAARRWEALSIDCVHGPNPRVRGTQVAVAGPSTLSGNHPEDGRPPCSLAPQAQSQVLCGSSARGGVLPCSDLRREACRGQGTTQRQAYPNVPTMRGTHLPQPAERPRQAAQGRKRRFSTSVPCCCQSLKH